MSKGSKRRIENFNKVQENWENIDWSPKIFCYDCGLRIDKKNLIDYPDLYEKFEDGAIRHRNCNYN